MRALLTRPKPCFNGRFVTMGGMPPIPLLRLLEAVFVVAKS